jgi:hypothetical protein
MEKVLEEFCRSYGARVSAFVSEIENLDTTGIPEPHLPHWGRLYENAPLKVGIIGRDTRSWGELGDFVHAVKENPEEALLRGKGEFDSLDFTEWTNNFGKTFWDTAMKILAGLHGISDWKRLKGRKEERVLRQFFWANANSIERFEVCPQENGVPWNVWRKVKDASETHLDSLERILKLFKPDVVVLMNWNPGDHFLDFEVEWNHFGDHQAYAIYQPSQTHIFMTAHPTWLNQNHLYDEAISGIIKRARKVTGRL